MQIDKRYKELLHLCMVLLMAAGWAQPARAQNSDCGNGLPCGSIPWPLPNPPQLASPTPLPTIGVTLNPPTQTPGGPTATPAPTQAGFAVDTSGIGNQFGTLQALAGATEQMIVVSGTPQSASAQLDTLAENSTTFFSYVRGLSELSLGGLTPLISFLVISFLVVIGVKAITLILPVLMAIFNFLKGLVQLVLDFIPL